MKKFDFSELKNNNSYILCVCEGKAEKAVVELLLKNGRLIFERKDLIEKELSKVGRRASDVEQYLNLEFDKKVVVLRVLDSRKESFKLNKIYVERGIQVVNIYTRPEIEILLILAEKMEKEYEKVKSDQKASDFCKQKFKKEKIKSEEYWKKRFENEMDCLIDAINRYAKMHPKENTLKDILMV